MMVILAVVIYSVFTGVTSEDSDPPNCTFDWIVGGKTLELYEVDLPTKLSLVMSFSQESITTLKIGLRMVEVFSRYVMGTPIVNEHYVKSESGFEESPELSVAELKLLYASATDIDSPIPFQITFKDLVKDEPIDRSRRYSQDIFEESVDRELSEEEVVPVLVNTPETTEENSPSPVASSDDEEATMERLLSSPNFDREWDDTESLTLKILREAKDPFKYLSPKQLMESLRTPEYGGSDRWSWLSDLPNPNTLGSLTPLPDEPSASSNSDLQSQDIEEVIRQKNLQFNQDIERAYDEGLSVDGANAIPCVDEEEVSSNSIPTRKSRLCKKGKGFSYDETKRRQNKNRQTKSRQKEQQKQREVRAAGDPPVTEPTTEDPAIVIAAIKKKNQFNIFGKTFRDILSLVGKCNDLVKHLELIMKTQTTIGVFPSHKSCFTEFKLSFISDDVERKTQEKSYNLQYFSDLIAKFEPQLTPNSQDIFLKGIGFYLLSELHDTLEKFMVDIHRRLSFFVRVVIQIGNRDLDADVAPLLTNAPCAGGLAPEDVKISSVSLHKNGVEGIYEISPIKRVKTYRRLQSVPYPVPGTNEYVYIYFEKDEYYDTKAPLIGSTASCEQVSKSYYCRSSTIVPKPRACMVALWYNSWDNIKENCNVGYKSQVNTPLTVSTSLGLLMADRSNVRAIKLHQAPGSETKDYIVDNPVILKYGGTITTNYGEHYQNFTANSGGPLKICRSTVTESRIIELRDIAKNMDLNDHFRTVRTFLDKYGWYIGIGSIVAGVLSLLNCLIFCSAMMFKCKDKNPSLGGSCASFLFKTRNNTVEVPSTIEVVPEPEERERLLRSNVDIQMRNLELSKAGRERKVRMNLEPRMSM